MSLARKYRIVPISSPWVSEDGTFLDFKKMCARWNFSSIFLKIVHQKGRFDAIKEKPNFPNCRWILHIYCQWLLSNMLDFVLPGKFVSLLEN